MLTYTKFSGINNVANAERLAEGELAEASNVDVGLTGELLRRKGYSRSSATAHRNLWAADGFTLATVGSAGDLTNITSSTVLRAALGNTRVRYANLPGGRTAYSNGTACGIVSSTGATTWGVPHPASIGSGANTTGSLHPGKYQYSITHVRSSDGLEGGPIYSAPVTVTGGGIALTSLPTLAGHTTNVYLTTHNGATRYLAGSTSGSTFTFSGANKDLVVPCRTDWLYPAPVGSMLGFWRGCALVAVGNALFASKPFQVELFDLRRDFKQFAANSITLIQPVADGIYVGTDRELAFLGGPSFDQLAYRQVLKGSVVLGSGVAVDGSKIGLGESSGSGDAMLCIADGGIVAGFAGGQIARLTDNRYSTAVTEVAATFRERDGIPQYIAIAQ